MGFSGLGLIFHIYWTYAISAVGLDSMVHAFTMDLGVNHNHNCPKPDNLGIMSPFWVSFGPFSKKLKKIDRVGF